MVRAFPSLPSLNRPRRLISCLSLLNVPINDGILELRLIELILAQTGLWSYKPPLLGRMNSYRQRLASVMCFLGIFAGHWTSLSERSYFSHQLDLDGPELLGPCYLQVHFRCFTHKESLTPTKDTDGLRCHRQRGEIASDTLEMTSRYFEERRISIFGVLSTQGWVAGMLPAYRVLVVAETGMDLNIKKARRDQEMDVRRRL